MKKRFLLLSLLFLIPSLRADQGVFSAINTLKQLTTNRPELVNKIAQIKGVHADPQPKDWIFMTIDPKARAGVRELTIEGEDIIEEKAPASINITVGNMVPIDLNRLKIDTSTLFDIADAEANKAKVGFDSVNYRLFTDANTGAPMWEVKLYRNASTISTPQNFEGKFFCSGETGIVTQPLQLPVHKK